MVDWLTVTVYHITVELISLLGSYATVLTCRSKHKLFVKGCNMYNIQTSKDLYFHNSEPLKPLKVEPYIPTPVLYFYLNVG